MKLRPLGARVLIAPDLAPERSRGGIIIPDAARETQSQGEILAIGADVAAVEPGQVVLFRNFRGLDVAVNGDKGLIVDERDLLGVIE